MWPGQTSESAGGYFWPHGRRAPRGVNTEISALSSCTPAGWTGRNRGVIALERGCSKIGLEEGREQEGRKEIQKRGREGERGREREGKIRRN